MIKRKRHPWVFESGVIDLKIALISQERPSKSWGETEVVKYRRKREEERSTTGMEGERNKQSSEQLIVCLTAL